MNGLIALVVFAVVYFYSHYFFASNTAHVTAMYAAFLSVVVAARVHHFHYPYYRVDWNRGPMVEAIRILVIGV